MRDYTRLASTAFARRGTARTVLVVGSGALGNEVIKNLALIGIETLWILDRDRVETSNLTRSILFCTSDIEDDIARGTPKAVVAARRVREVNPDVAVTSFVGEIADLGYGVIRRADLVFSCVDNEMARLELGWACARLARPVIDGGLGLMNYSSGQVTVFPPRDGPCYACRKGAERRRRLMQEMQGREDPCWRKESAAEAEGVATTPLMASVVGALQVELAVRGLQDGFPERLGRAYRITLHPVPALDSGHFERSPSCPLHEPSSLVETTVSCASGSEVTTPLMLFQAAAVTDGYLAFDWPMTLAASCRDCGHRWEPMVRRARFRQARCPACGGTDLVETSVGSGVGADSPLASRPLVELGLPRAHVHEVADARRPDAPPVHVEMTADLAGALASGA